MKKKLENCTVNELITFMKTIKNPLSWRITWQTSDGLLHLYSLETLKDITNQEMEPNTVFTIWQEG